MQHKRSIVVILLVLLSLVGSTVAFAQDDPALRTRAERAEIRFLEGMIDHHQMALDMAADCLVKAETEAVRTLCQNVITAQSAEILTMRGWLLAWYHIEYQPMSMMQMQGGTPDMGMMGDGMGMEMMPDGMGMEMMAQMMEMMMGMMANGMGMGMMGGDMPQGQGPAAGIADDMQMMEMMNILYALQTVTLGDLMEMTAEVDAATPFIEVLRHHVNTMTGDMPMDPAGLLATMDNMSMGQMMVIFAQLHSLTLADVQEMMGHLDDPENKTLTELMQHHIETMVNAPAAAGDDHDAHHPEGQATAEPDASGMDDMEGMDDTGDMDDMEGMDDMDDMSAAGGPVTGFVDPAMGMGMFAGFNYLTGVAYEIAWLESMIDHHDDALHMAARIMEQAVHEELATFAQGIIDAQTAEIEQMEGLLVELSAE